MNLFYILDIIGLLGVLAAFILFVIYKGTYQVSQAEVIVIERFENFMLCSNLASTF